MSGNSYTFFKPSDSSKTDHSSIKDKFMAGILNKKEVIYHLVNKNNIPFTEAEIQAENWRKEKKGQ